MTVESDPEQTRGVRSTVHVLGHPIHPLLIPFPIAFLVGAALTDFVFAVSGEGFWASGSFWLIGAGVTTGVVAAATGLIDFLTIERAQEHLSGWVHLVGNVLVLLISLGNLLPRVGDHDGFIEPWGLTLSLVVAGLLVITGWTGGELSYRHQIGVTGH